MLRNYEKLKSDEQKAKKNVVTLQKIPDEIFPVLHR